jgi:poly-gamma-glutamate synthesis protein (capsule biosynthesis protein)
LIAAVRAANAQVDVVVGSHTHTLLGSGWIGKTYVDYGLGNFLWYHDHQPDTGVLRLTIRDGEVVEDSWTPARIRRSGRTLALGGRRRAEAISAWRRLRDCAGLSATRDAAPSQGRTCSVDAVAEQGLPTTASAGYRHLTPSKGP